MTPVEDIIRDPSSWVNKTVTVEGILATVPQPNPTSYRLFPENLTTDCIGQCIRMNIFLNGLNVQWNSSDVLNATAAIVHGVIREELWTAPNVMPPISMNVFYIEAENVELILPPSSSQYPITTPTPTPTATPEPTPKVEPFPTVLVVAFITSVAIIGAGVLVYFRKRKRVKS